MISNGLRNSKSVFAACGHWNADTSGMHPSQTCPAFTFSIAMSLFNLTLVYVSYVWTTHVDPRCARVVLGYAWARSDRESKAVRISIFLTHLDHWLYAFQFHDSSNNSLLPVYILICVIVNAWPFLEILDRRHVSLAQLTIFLSMNGDFTFCWRLPFLLCIKNANSFGLRSRRYIIKRNQLYIFMWVLYSFTAYFTTSWARASFIGAANATPSARMKANTNIRIFSLVIKQDSSVLVFGRSGRPRKAKETDWGTVWTEKWERNGRLRSRSHRSMSKSSRLFYLSTAR